MSLVVPYGPGCGEGVVAAAVHSLRQGTLDVVDPFGDWWGDFLMEIFGRSQLLEILGGDSIGKCFTKSCQLGRNKWLEYSLWRFQLVSHEV